MGTTLGEDGSGREEEMSRTNPGARIPFVLPAMIAVWLAAAAGPLSTQNPPEHPREEALFTSPPSDIAQVPSITPLGSLNPAASHVLPKDHMHFQFPHPASGGLDHVPAFAMAAGKVVMLTRNPQADAPPGVFQYTIFIRHNESVTSYYDHVNELSARISNHLNSVPNPWINVHGSQLMILGQMGAPTPLPVAAGEEVGVARSYVHSWDIGVVDRRVHNVFAGHGPRRYPGFDDFFKLLGLNLTSPIPGNKTINAVCFINYLAPTFRQAWFNLLESNPKTCGRVSSDIEEKLSGNWFNPAVDEAAVPPLFDLDAAGLSLTPDTDSPNDHVQIGIGSNNPFAALDPHGNYPQLQEAFSIAMDKTAGARINPDPVNVDHSTGTVCYDLSFHSHSGLSYNVLLLKMETARRLLIKFDGTTYNAAQCSMQLINSAQVFPITYAR
jgi:hypothetical protein